MRRDPDLFHSKRSIRESERLGYEVVEMWTDWCSGPCCVTKKTIDHNGVKVDVYTMHAQHHKRKKILVRADEFKDPEPVDIHPDWLIGLVVVAMMATLIWMCLTNVPSFLRWNWF